MIATSKRGLGDFPEFIGLKLATILLDDASDIDPLYPFGYNFCFTGKGCNVIHKHCCVTEMSEKDTRGNSRFVGLEVTRAYQSRIENQNVFTFEFGNHVLRFCYDD